MANVKLNRTDLESEIQRSFRLQFSNLQIFLDGEKVTLDKTGELGFNPIPEQAFCGSGIYSMHGWVKVFRHFKNGGMQSLNTKFDVQVVVDLNDEVNIQFDQPIILKPR